jgi:hypothetical protein
VTWKVRTFAPEKGLARLERGFRWRWESGKEWGLKGNVGLEIGEEWCLKDEVKGRMEMAWVGGWR